MDLLFFIACMTVEAWVHASLIKKGIDPTPDGKLTINHLITFTFRAVVIILPYMLFGMGNFWLYLACVLCLHVLLYPMILNLLRESLRHLSLIERISYLGNGKFDRVLSNFSIFERISLLTILFAMLYLLYYDTF